MARGMKFRIYEVEGLYNPCSENIGADQLRGYREADLRLCFRIYKKPVFPKRGSNVTVRLEGVLNHMGRVRVMHCYDGTPSELLL